MGHNFIRMNKVVGVVRLDIEGRVDITGRITAHTKFCKKLVGARLAWTPQARVTTMRLPVGEGDITA